MVSRRVQFTDTGEWCLGTKRKDGPFRQDLQEWAAQIGRVHGRPVKGYEFEDPADDPITGIPVQDDVTTTVIDDVPSLTPREVVQLKAFAATLEDQNP